MDAQTLKDLGLTKAGERLNSKTELKKKMTIAYEFYRFVEPHVIERFSAELKTKTYQEDKLDQYRTKQTWHVLKFIKLEDYPEVPPADCLLDLKRAKEHKCFDWFEIVKTEVYSTIEDKTPRPDPIIFGRITGCEDRFFISQWDNDVLIDDILKG